MERNIYAYKCKKCGELHYPYRTICKKCGENEHNEFDIVPMAKKGKLVTYTVLHNPTADFEVATLSLGIVQLDDGLKMLGQLNIKEPKTGMRVTGKVDVVRKTTYDKYYGMIFSKE